MGPDMLLRCQVRLGDGRLSWVRLYCNIIYYLSWNHVENYIGAPDMPLRCQVRLGDVRLG